MVTKKQAPSNKMKTVYKDIVDVLGIKFEGNPNSFEDVHAFIDAHIDEWREAKDNLPPSEKQLKGAQLVLDRLGIEFEGTTRREMKEFLDTYLQEAINTKKGETPW